MVELGRGKKSLVPQKAVVKHTLTSGQQHCSLRVARAMLATHQSVLLAFSPPLHTPPSMESGNPY